MNDDRDTLPPGERASVALRAYAAQLVYESLTKDGPTMDARESTTEGLFGGMAGPVNLLTTTEGDNQPGERPPPRPPNRKARRAVEAIKRAGEKSRRKRR